MVRTIATARYDAGHGRTWTARLSQIVDGRKAGLYFADYHLAIAKGPPKRQRPYAGTRDEEEARVWFDQYVREAIPLEVSAALAPTPHGPSRNPTVAEILTWYVDTVQVARGDTEGTRKANRRIFARFAESLAAREVVTVAELAADPGAATEYVAARGRVRKVGTVRRDVASIRAAFRAAVVDRRIPADPVPRWNVPDAQEPEYPALMAADDLRRLLEHLRTGVHEGNRHAPLGQSQHYNVVRFIAYTGIRPVDACRLTRDRVFLDAEGGPQLRVRQKKTSKPTALALSEAAAEAIADELARGIRSAYVFTGRDGEPLQAKLINAAMVHHCRQLGIPRITPKTCRVYVVSTAIAAGYDAEYVRAVSGHDSVAIRRYIRRVQRVAHGLANQIADTLTMPAGTNGCQKSD